MEKINTQLITALALASAAITHTAIAHDDWVKPQKKLTAELVRLPDAVLEKSAAVDNISVIIELHHADQLATLKQMKAELTSAEQPLQNRIRALVEQQQPEHNTRSTQAEIALAAQARTYTPLLIDQSIKHLNARRDDVRSAITHKHSQILKAQAEKRMTPFSEFIESLGGTVNGRITTGNLMAVSIPSVAIYDVLNHPEVVRIMDTPSLTPELDNQAASVGVANFWNAGFNGGTYDVGIIDTEIDASHSALSNQTVVKSSVQTTSSDHGLNVACAYASNHTTYKGLAHGLDKILNSSPGAGTGNVATAMSSADWMMNDTQDTPEVINLSYGAGGGDSDWGDMAKFVDSLVYAYNVTWIKSAGNRGYLYQGGNLTAPAEAYNAITVGNVDDTNSTNRSLHSIYLTSSVGPTSDGRKKPDLVAPGHDTMTCGANNTFILAGGTSMAAPKVGAIALLLMDAGHSHAKSVKATLINTADAWENFDTLPDLDVEPWVSNSEDDEQVSGSEWNGSYGWGYMNAEHAYVHRNDYFVDTVQPEGQAGDVKFYLGYAYPGDKATLVWEREVSYNDDQVPTQWEDLNDIDLWLYDQGSNAVEDQDTSIINNVHQVAVSNQGLKVIKVVDYESPYSTQYALATEENFTEVSLPDFSATKNWVALGGNQYQVSVAVTNTGDLTAHNIRIKPLVPSGVTLSSGYFFPPPLEAQNTATVYWTATTSNSSLLNSLNYDIDSYSYGEDIELITN